MNILVTGCAGSTGSIVCERLISDGHSVIGVDNLFNATRENLAKIRSHKNFTFVQGSILDRALLKKLQEKTFEQIFNFAAIVETKYFYSAPVKTYETNCHGTKLMLDFAKDNNVKAFLNASSSEVFGHQSEFPSKLLNKITYDSPLSSVRWSYAVGKLISEYLGLAYSKFFKVVSLRYANLYGPRDMHTNHIIPYTIRNLLQNGKVTLTDGSDVRMRSFLHTDDCAEGTIMALNKGKNANIYSLGGKEEYSITHLVELIGELLGIKPEIELQGDRPGDPMRRLLDTSELTEDTGWQQKVGLVDGLKQMIGLHRNQSRTQ